MEKTQLNSLYITILGNQKSFSQIFEPRVLYIVIFTEDWGQTDWNGHSQWSSECSLTTYNGFNPVFTCSSNIAARLLWKIWDKSYYLFAKYFHSFFFSLDYKLKKELLAQFEKCLPGHETSSGT
jgi:hypothetical protein